jgi:hypothetical protein
MGCGGYFLTDFEQIGRPTNCIVIATVPQSLQQKLQLDRLAIFVERDDMSVDAGVGVVVEIVGPENQGDFVANFGQQEQATEHCPFGFDTARGLAVEHFAERLLRNGACCSVNRGHGSRSVGGGGGTEIDSGGCGASPQAMPGPNERGGAGAEAR